MCEITESIKEDIDYLKKCESDLKVGTYDHSCLVYIKSLESKLAEALDSNQKRINEHDETKTRMHKKLTEAMSLLNEAAPLVAKVYLRTQWFDRLNKLTGE